MQCLNVLSRGETYIIFPAQHQTGHLLVSETWLLLCTVAMKLFSIMKRVRLNHHTRTSDLFSVLASFRITHLDWSRLESRRSSLSNHFFIKRDEGFGVRYTKYALDSDWSEIFYSFLISYTATLTVMQLRITVVYLLMHFKLYLEVFRMDDFLRILGNVTSSVVFVLLSSKDREGKKKESPVKEPQFIAALT